MTVSLPAGFFSIDRSNNSNYTVRIWMNPKYSSSFGDRDLFKRLILGMASVTAFRTLINHFINIISIGRINNFTDFINDSYISYLRLSTYGIYCLLNSISLIKHHIKTRAGYNCFTKLVRMSFNFGD